MNKYSIGQAAAEVGLPSKTIRFYEDEGVITKATRQDNGYRIYEQKSIEELKLIKYARDLGIPLVEIKKLMKGCENGDCTHSKNYIEATISNYLKILNEKINQMMLLRTKLEDLKEKIDNKKNCSDGKYCCDILHQLLSVNN